MWRHHKQFPRVITNLKVPKGKSEENHQGCGCRPTNIDGKIHLDMVKPRNIFVTFVLSSPSNFSNPNLGWNSFVTGDLNQMSESVQMWCIWWLFYFVLCFQVFRGMDVVKIWASKMLLISTVLTCQKKNIWVLMILSTYLFMNCNSLYNAQEISRHVAMNMVVIISIALTTLPLSAKESKLKLFCST